MATSQVPLHLVASDCVAVALGRRLPSQMVVYMIWLAAEQMAL